MRGQIILASSPGTHIVQIERKKKTDMSQGVLITSASSQYTQIIWEHFISQTTCKTKLPVACHVWFNGFNSSF